MRDEALVEAVVSAWRERVRGEVRPSPAWADLDAAGRVRAYEEAVIARRIEAALDPEGLSGASRAVLARIRRG
jgi:hypothetical protein